MSKQPAFKIGISKHRDGWTGEKCPVCKGTGESLSNPTNSGPCKACGGTGEEYDGMQDDRNQP